MRWADVLGKGRPQLVISPLNATVGNGVRLTAFEIPDAPTKDRWPATVLESELNRMHNHWHLDFDGQGAIDTLTASREGVHLIQRAGDTWSKTKLAAGATADEPNQNGAGEVKSGRLKSGARFIATVEPMHGTSPGRLHRAPEARRSLGSPCHRRRLQTGACAVDRRRRWRWIRRDCVRTQRHAQTYLG